MAPHPQVLAMVGKDWDNENLISKLTPKEASDILNLPTPTIRSQQVTNIKVVMHHHANKGQPPGEWQTGYPYIPAYINQGHIPNHPSDLGQHSKTVGTYLLLDKEVVAN